MGSAWCAIEVTGIHCATDAVYVQVTSASDLASGVVLRMAPLVTPGQALAALEACGELPPPERPHVVDVMRTVRSAFPRPALA
jgi:hypothetical protein